MISVIPARKSGTSDCSSLVVRCVFLNTHFLVEQKSREELLPANHSIGLGVGDWGGGDPDDLTPLTSWLDGFPILY